MGRTYHPDTTNGIIPGDLFVGLFGANIPFILRRLGNAERYTMLNAAYVEGHIYGHKKVQDAPEGMRVAEVCRNLERFGLREYAIV